MICMHNKVEQSCCHHVYKYKSEIQVSFLAVKSSLLASYLGRSSKDRSHIYTTSDIVVVYI